MTHLEMMRRKRNDRLWLVANFQFHSQKILRCELNGSDLHGMQAFWHDHSSVIAFGAYHEMQ